MTSIGFFDPISICNFVMLAIALAAMPRPTGTEPVKLIASTSRLSTSLWPTALPCPVTRLKRPAGMSCFTMISVSATALAGVRFAGFHTTALPKASAGAIFQAGVATGKFHGLMMATTPTGSRRTSISIPGRTLSARSP